ncbi:hypothetical protein BKA80DRAFT_65469 [Phyllosticta citrichinensis]
MLPCFRPTLIPSNLCLSPGPASGLSACLLALFESSMPRDLLCTDDLDSSVNQKNSSPPCSFSSPTDFSWFMICRHIPSKYSTSCTDSSCLVRAATINRASC